MWKWFIFGIVLVGFLLRVVDVSNYPAGFTPDEASFGYDAYSLVHTGKDQWGRTLPLYLESFGDYKFPLYAYILTPFVWMFGLSKAVVRFPNVLIGSFAIYALYLLVKELFDKRTALVSAVLISLSSWHIMMSRGAFEANLATFLIPLGLFLFIKKRYVPCAIVFGLGLFSYHSALYVLLILVPLVFLIYKVFDRKFAAVFLVFVIASFYSLSQGAFTRVADINIVSASLGAASDKRIELTKQGVPDFYARLIHNKYQVAANTFLKNYFSYFSPRFLMLEGPAEATYGMLPGKGVVYLVEVPFLAYGLWLVLSRLKTKENKLLASWLLLAPVPAALAIGPGYAANRAVLMLPVLLIIISIGVSRLKGKLFGVFAVLYFFSVIFFVNDYFLNQPIVGGKAMLSGNIEVANWLEENVQSPLDIRVSRRLSEPHIYFGFVSSWDPVAYQIAAREWDYKEWGRQFLDQHPAYSLGRYSFADIDDLAFENFDLLVGRPYEFREYDVKDGIIKRFYYTNGEEAVWVVDNSIRRI